MENKKRKYILKNLEPNSKYIKTKLRKTKKDEHQSLNKTKNVFLKKTNERK